MKKIISKDSLNTITDVAIGGALINTINHSNIPIVAKNISNLVVGSAIVGRTYKRIKKYL